MPEIVSRWAEATKILAQDGNAHVACPVCQKANLLVKDIPIATTSSSVLERRMICPSCHVQLSLKLEQPLN